MKRDRVERIAALADKAECAAYRIKHHIKYNSPPLDTDFILEQVGLLYSATSSLNDMYKETRT